jgi:hypothetical protein
MQETSTQKTPEGLEGYMDDTHPYHEAVEITRVPDPTNRSSYVSHTIYQMSSHVYPVKLTANGLKLAKKQIQTKN